MLCFILRAMNYMIKCVLVIVIIVNSMIINGQVDIIVQDQEGTPLGYVDVYSEDFSFKAVTNDDGVVILSSDLNPQMIINFSLLGYDLASKTVVELTSNSTVIMQEGVLLDEITMVGRIDNKSRDLPGRVESIDAKVFQLTNPQTSADALAQHSDVFIQKSQLGGGSPIVRGFEANRVLLVVDGVRLNNAIYRSGHLQNAVTVDNAVLERLEVFHGAGSLIYGSDAIGGVVHFRSKNPTLNFDTEKSYAVSSNAYIRHSTANNEKTAHVDVNIGGSKFGSFTSITASDFEDLKTGTVRSDSYPTFGTRPFYVNRVNGVDVLVENENENVQIGTGYSQLDLLQKFLYRPSKALRLIANFQLSTSTNVPRYDALTEPDGQGLRFAEWYYGPQNRFLASVRMDHEADTKMYDKLIAIAAFQKIDEDRIDRRFGSENLDRNNEDVNVYSLTLDLHKFLNTAQTFELNYGAEVNRNTLESTAIRTDINTGVITNDILTRYPSGGGSTSNVGAYALVKNSFRHWDLYSGLRLSDNTLNVRYLRSDGLPWPSEFFDGVTNRNTAFSWSIGGTLHEIDGWRVSSQLSSAFRSPNIDDQAKIRVNTNEISVPNLDLNPETSNNVELILSKEVEKIGSISVTGFYTWLNNAIVRDQFSLPDGTSFLVDEGDTLATVANINAEQAEVYGLSINTKIALGSYVTMDGSVSSTKGIRRSENGVESPLAHIPPLYGRLAFSYQGKNQQINFTTRFNGEKPVELYGGSEDNLENATVDGTPAWYTLNAYYKRNINDAFSFSFAVENILDVHYRPFASGVSAPVRNFIFTLNGSFL